MGKYNGKIEGRVIRDPDGMIAYHYIRNGNPRRQVLFQIDKGTGKLLIKDHGSGDLVIVGQALEIEGITLYVFF